MKLKEERAQIVFPEIVNMFGAHERGTDLYASTATKS